MGRVEGTRMQMGDSRGKHPATTSKLPFRRGVHEFRLLSCCIPTRRRLRDKIFLLPSDSSAPGSPSSEGVSSIDVDDDEFFSDEDARIALLLTTDSSSSLESTLDTTATTTLPDECADAKAPLAAHEQCTSSRAQLMSTMDATEESFVFSPPALLADNLVLETPSFRTLSDPLLSTFSYDCSGDAVSLGAPSKSSVSFSWISVTSRSSPPILAHNLGDRHAQRPPSAPATSTSAVAAPQQTRAVWLPLPALPPDVGGSCSHGSTMSSSSSELLRFTSSSAGSAASSSAAGSENRGDSSVGSWSSIRHGHGQMGGLPLPPPSVATQLLPGLHSFDFSELRDATQGFAPERCLENGAFGSVYRASVKPASNQQSGPMKAVELAVLRLAANDNQTLQDWKADVQILARLPRDRHISVIQGYCAHEETVSSRVDRLLVFEQSPCGTLHDYLGERRQSNSTHVDWPLRIGILLGAARGLLYIHDRAPAQILYRDFKATSVLLDQDYMPRLAGYGLAVTSWPSAADNKSSFSTVMKISQAHAKTNVWSFGVVLLEVLTGQDSRDGLSVLYCDERSFVQWAAPFLKDEAKLVLILDPRLKATQWPVKGALQLAALAMQCLKKKAAQRPRMGRVVDTLKTLVPDSSTRAADQPNKRRATSFGGISFRDAEHRSKFVGQYLSVQGANSAGFDGDKCPNPNVSVF